MQLIDPRPVDILDGHFYLDDPHPRFAWLREHAPVCWDEHNELWVVTRYDDIVEIEKRKHLFINSDQHKGGYRPNIPADASIIGLDDPIHTARRRLVARRFTPRAVAGWEDHVEEMAANLIDDAVAAGQVEVIADLAAPLPASMIGLLLGFPEEMWPKLKEWSERTIVLGGGPRYMTEDGIIAAMDFAGACAELYEEKGKCPADDVMSVWRAEEAAGAGKVGGEDFGLDQVISDCLLLLDGGAETTRTVIARILIHLADDAEAWAALKGGADMTVAVEEFIRWVTPIHNFGRVATDDTEIAGQEIRAGEQVVLCYGSANRDPEHFGNPNTFDVTRTPNNHLSFGFGTHFCLGASLARMELNIFFSRLIERVDRIERLTDRPHEEMPNPFVYGVAESHLELFGV